MLNPIMVVTVEENLIKQDANVETKNEILRRIKHNTRTKHNIRTKNNIHYIFFALYNITNI